MGKNRKFRAVIESARGGGAYVAIPFDAREVFGKKRVKVTARIGGEPYRGLLVRMGTSCHVLGVLWRSARKQATLSAMRLKSNWRKIWKGGMSKFRHNSWQRSRKSQVGWRCFESCRIRISGSMLNRSWQPSANRHVKHG